MSSAIKPSRWIDAVYEPSFAFFLPGCTAERVFRVDSGQEHLHYITDISSDDLYILDPAMCSDAEPLG